MADKNEVKPAEPAAEKKDTEPAPAEKIDNAAVPGDKKVNWVLTLVLSILFGGIGVDRFLMGKIGTGILKLITFGGFGIWYVIDIILIATKHKFKGVEWEVN
tara:strand:+ start:54 stop:359 length:306 start_codon:yes stop_codon:yes gene_type:complete